jgi:HSP20 family protein
MELRVLNTNHMPEGWLANQLTSVWKDFARDLNGATNAHITPTADVVEDAEGYQFFFEMPGLKSDSVDVRVEEGRLVVEAERVRPEWSKDIAIHLNERSYGPMRRTFKLPEDAVIDGISASYRDGILNVRVPKKPEAKPLKIKVSSD